MYNKQELMDLFRERALKFGDFTLASGKKAKYYLDGKQVTLHARGLSLVSQGFLDLLDPSIDAVGGMSIGADPIVAGILSAAASKQSDLLGFLVRKESKGHGTNKFVEGPVQPGMKVAIVEDVVTTGGSSLLAIERVQEFGCEVKQVLSIIDRMEGGANRFRELGFDFQSLLTIEDFGITPPEPS
ncbi:orotate phosphoribosyltransferase [Thalassoglobus sp. JC818]|uniref:orotate phosphoribosyltransferase n=1 Tax=Thalassoglobus sp. JC818 TaxID=3232136 RepID=UPI003457C4F9